MPIHIRVVHKCLQLLAVILTLSCAANIAAAQSVPMLVQAEAMTLSAPMTAAYDIAAMRGRVISPTSGTDTMFPSRSASVEITLPAAGTYYLWARIAGPTSTSDALYVGIDSSFDRVFPSAPGAYEWVRVETSDGSGAHGFGLTAGNHTIQVGHGEIGAKLDALYVTANATEVPSFTAPARLLIEAESMTRVAPMTVGGEVAALGGQYLSPTSGTTSMTPAREAASTVHMPAGTWYLWARIAGPTSTSDALYVGVNASFDRAFPSAPGPYQWVRVETADGSGAHGFVLGAGAHIVQVGHGEIGAKLDAVYLTSDAAETPTFAPMRRVIEAETMTLTSPMTVSVDAAASGAQYISPTSGTTSTSPVREAFTSVTAPVSGTYYLWARLWGATDTSDALYLGFDSAFARAFPGALGTYEWVRVESAPDNFGFNLTAGEHDIQVGHGEIGARLDAVYVTDDANDFPTGSTPPPSSGFPALCAVTLGSYEGFGRHTTGGFDVAKGVPLEIYEVTHLGDSDPPTAGSLRAALSQGNRCISFRKLTQGGTINLVKPLVVRSSNITIDGFTAPAPGITLENKVRDDTLLLHGGEPDIANCPATAPVNNVVIRGIRIRSAPRDGISLYYASNVVMDRVSISNAGDGGIDVTRCSRNVTIQWSMFGEMARGSLIAYGAERVSVHHNVFVNARIRHPLCSGGPSLNDVVCDTRNNLVWNYDQGSEAQNDGTGNFVNNYYNSCLAGTTGCAYKPTASNTIKVEAGGRAYTAGNYSQNGWNINANGNSPEFPVHPDFVPATSHPRTAAITARGTADGRDGAGARGPAFGLDQFDQDLINSVTIP